VKATLLSSPANWLLVALPFAIASSHLGWNEAVVFILNFLAIFPLAELLSYSTEQLSASVGQIVGGMLNATFGNAVEMIVGITALSRDEFRIVQSSMVGSILSGTLLILGSCFVAGGWSRDTLTWTKDVTSIMSSLMMIASISLIIPSALSATFAESTELDGHILVLSYVTSIILLIFYIVYLYFQMGSHKHLFTEEDEESHDLGPIAASIVLILATVGVMVCSDSLVESIDGIVEASGVSRTFIGLIIVPIVGNAGEYATTVKASMKGKLNLAVSVVVGSTLQIALFVTPFLVILGWIIGHNMDLRFDTFETTVLFLSVVVVTCLIRDGKTNYFEGALLCGTYFLIGIAFYVHPE
ncbi:Calcium/proton exchanger, partial [Acephala macrosclerotiorum]